MLVPYLSRNPNEVPRLWLTVEGEALLVVTRITPGTTVSDLAAADLGPWEEDGFHVLGRTGLGGTDAGAVQFGAGYRNGLGRAGPISGSSNPGARRRIPARRAAAFSGATAISATPSGWQRRQ